MAATRSTRTDRFVGRIAGFGTTSGTRFVVGSWRDSPFGAFTDVMVERTDGHRLLLAPSVEIAEYVGSTYSFDAVRVVPVTVTEVGGSLHLEAGPLAADIRIGEVTPLGRLLRLVPRAFATRPGWLTLIDPVARIVMPGVRTAGSAGAGRREYYGVTAARSIPAVAGTWDGADFGTLAPLAPPVRFGFGSAPSEPHIVDVTTTIRLPHR